MRVLDSLKGCLKPVLSCYIRVCFLVGNRLRCKQAPGAAVDRDRYNGFLICLIQKAQFFKESAAADVVLPDRAVICRVGNMPHAVQILFQRLAALRECFLRGFNRVLSCNTDKAPVQGQADDQHDRDKDYRERNIDCCPDAAKSCTRGFPDRMEAAAQREQFSLKPLRLLPPFRFLRAHAFCSICSLLYLDGDCPKVLLNT